MSAPLVTCDHPNLPDQPITIPKSVLPGHMALGWVPREPGNEPEQPLVERPDGEPAAESAVAPAKQSALAAGAQPADDTSESTGPASAPADAPVTKKGA